MEDGCDRLVNEYRYTDDELADEEEFLMCSRCTAQAFYVEEADRAREERTW